MLYFTRGDAPPAEEEYTIPIGVADVKRQGSDLTIATFSYCVLQALEAGRAFREAPHRGGSGRPGSVEPLDIDTVLASVAKTGRLLAVHESYGQQRHRQAVGPGLRDCAPPAQKPRPASGHGPVSIPVSKTLEEEVLPWKRQMVATVLEMMK